MHVCMVHVSMIRLKFCYGRTNEQGDSRSRINRISFDEDEDGGVVEMLMWQADD